MIIRSLIFSCLLLLLTFLTGCFNNNPNDQGHNKSQHLPEDSVYRAERFSIQRTSGYTKLTIFDPWQGTNGVRQVYYLVKRGEESKVNADSATVIRVPVSKIICMSSTHHAMITALGENRSIKGISGTNYIYNRELKSAVDSGYIEEIGYDAGINSEVILKINPDLIMMYGIGSESSGYVGKISELGIRIMYDADYLETDPVGKAEWIKVFGALYCKEKLADSIFTSIVNSYDSIKTFIAENSKTRPSVLLGLPFRDTWFISPGNSYISTLISDAGGEYIWGNSKSSTSMPYSFETVFLKSLKADFWLNTGTAAVKNEISAFDNRLEKLPCFISGNIYNNTKRMSIGGGNDYWESGTLNPNIILRDIASILHPGLFNGSDLVYYRKIE
jgi:iron complex transport system substrate-binding protein